MSQNLEHYLKMLKSSDAAQRKEAIVMLGKSADKRALKPLAEIYKTDPDPALRELALKAGRYLQKNTTNIEPPEPEAPPPPPKKANAAGLMFLSAEGEAASNSSSQQSSKASGGKSKSKDAGAVPDWMNEMGAEKPKQKKVTDADRRKAKGYIDRAIDAQVRGERDKVIDFLEAAIETNPEMEKDSQLLGLLAMVVGNSSDPIAGLRAYRESQGKAGKRRKKATQADYTEIINFVTEMAIWSIVLALIISGVAYLLVSSIDWETAGAEAAAEGAPPEELEFYQNADNFFSDRDVIIAVLMVSFGYSGITIVYSTAVSIFTWMVGTFLGGTGLLFDFITGSTRALIIIIVVTTVCIFSPLFVETSLETGVYLSIAPCFFGMGYMGWTIGKVHEFGMAMGCVNMVAAVFACNFACTALNFITAL